MTFKFPPLVMSRTRHTLLERFDVHSNVSSLTIDFRNFPGYDEISAATKILESVTVDLIQARCFVNVDPQRREVVQHYKPKGLNDTSLAVSAAAEATYTEAVTPNLTQYFYPSHVRFGLVSSELALCQTGLTDGANTLITRVPLLRRFHTQPDSIATAHAKWGPGGLPFAAGYITDLSVLPTRTPRVALVFVPLTLDDKTSPVAFADVEITVIASGSVFGVDVIEPTAPAAVNDS
jgi:hypothetical protein